MLILGCLASFLVVSIAVGVQAGAESTQGSEPKPTIVLVHGAWADASSWSRVATRLQSDGYTVLAPANPLRGLATDAAYLRSVLNSVAGPIVLVGHSYGGMVMTNAATGDAQVKALVYIAAFVPNVGETVGGLTALNPGSQLGPAALIFRPTGGGVDAYIAPVAFRGAFAQDLPAITAAEMAAAQRPISVSVLGEPSGPPSWATIPSWYMVAGQDHTIPPATEWFMAHRAGATTVEVDGSHVVMISHAHAVEELIVEAARAVG